MNLNKISSSAVPIPVYRRRNLVLSHTDSAENTLLEWVFFPENSLRVQSSLSVKVILNSCLLFSLSESQGCWAQRAKKNINSDKILSTKNNSHPSHPVSHRVHARWWSFCTWLWEHGFKLPFIKVHYKKFQALKLFMFTVDMHGESSRLWVSLNCCAHHILFRWRWKELSCAASANGVQIVRIYDFVGGRQAESVRCSTGRRAFLLENAVSRFPHRLNGSQKANNNSARPRGWALPTTGSEICVRESISSPMDVCWCLGFVEKKTFITRAAPQTGSLSSPLMVFPPFIEQSKKKKIHPEFKRKRGSVLPLSRQQNTEGSIGWAFFLSSTLLLINNSEPG